jgi:glutamate dehydrogenase
MAMTSPHRVVLTDEDRRELIRRARSENCAAWLVRNRQLPLRITREVGVFRGTVAALASSLPDVLDPASRADVEERTRVLGEAGVAPEVAPAVALLDPLAAAFDVAELSQHLSRDPVQVTAVYFAIGERLDLRGIRARISGARVDSHWTSIAKAALLDELSGQQRRLTAVALHGAPAGAGVGDAVDRWTRDNESGLARWDALSRELRRGGGVRLAPVVVAVQVLRDLATSTGRGAGRTRLQPA